MSFLAILAMAIALAMDALAVAMVTGMTLSPLRALQILRMSLSFGLFQALMPVLGYASGKAVYRYIAAFDHWVAFGLLALVGGKMVYEAIWEKAKDEKQNADPTRGFTLVLLSVATSIDALAVGISLSMINTSIAFPALMIGVVCAAFTAGGMLVGRRISGIWGSRVELLGGVILIVLGVKILAEHIGR